MGKGGGFWILRYCHNMMSNTLPFSTIFIKCFSQTVQSNSVCCMYSFKMFLSFFQPRMTQTLRWIQGKNLSDGVHFICSSLWWVEDYFFSHDWIISTASWSHMLSFITLFVCELSTKHYLNCLLKHVRLQNCLANVGCKLVLEERKYLKIEKTRLFTVFFGSLSFSCSALKENNGDSDISSDEADSPSRYEGAEFKSSLKNFELSESKRTRLRELEVSHSLSISCLALSLPHTYRLMKLWSEPCC